MWNGSSHTNSFSKCVRLGAPQDGTPAKTTANVAGNSGSATLAVSGLPAETVSNVAQPSGRPSGRHYRGQSRGGQLSLRVTASFPLFLGCPAAPVTLNKKETTLLALRLRGVFFEDSIERVHKKVRVLFGEDQRRPQLDHVVMRTVRARENPAIAKPIH